MIKKSRALVFINPIPGFENIFITHTNVIVKGFQQEMRAEVQYRDIVEPVNRTLPVRLLWLTFRKWELRLRVACTAHLLVIVLATITLLTYGTIAAFQVSILMCVSSLFLIINFYWAHSDMYPGQSKVRLLYALKFLVYPPIAIRAMDILTIPLFKTYHPITVAWVIARRKECELLIGRFIRELLYPTPEGWISGAQTYAGDMPQYRSYLLKQIQAFTIAKQIDISQSMYPAGWNKEYKGLFCPRCLTEYTLGVSECKDCHGVILVSSIDLYSC
jgi:hypothetical protein